MIYGIIPARFASTRLPGKPLAKIAGRPMIQWVYESAKHSKLVNDLIVATDDRRVFDAVEEFGGNVVMTPDNIKTGSDRIAFVAKELSDCTIVVNIQGDEPFIPGMMIDQAIEPFLFDQRVYMSTLIKRITKTEELESPSTVKVVFDGDNYALYFSRAPIPFVRDNLNTDLLLEKGIYFKHIGLYVYRKEYLLKFTGLQSSYLEDLEKLEQLRVLENGYKIKCVETTLDSISVDTPMDLADANIFARSLNKN